MRKSMEQIYKVIRSGGMVIISSVMRSEKVEQKT